SRRVDVASPRARTRPKHVERVDDRPRRPKTFQEWAITPVMRTLSHSHPSLSTGDAEGKGRGIGTRGFPRWGHMIFDCRTLTLPRGPRRVKVSPPPRPLFLAEQARQRRAALQPAEALPQGHLDRLPGLARRLGDRPRLRARPAPGAGLVCPRPPPNLP